MPPRSFTLTSSCRATANTLPSSESTGRRSCTHTHPSIPLRSAIPRTGWEERTTATSRRRRPEPRMPTIFWGSWPTPSSAATVVSTATRSAWRFPPRRKAQRSGIRWTAVRRRRSRGWPTPIPFRFRARRCCGRPRSSPATGRQMSTPRPICSPAISCARTGQAWLPMPTGVVRAVPTGRSIRP